MNQPFRPLTGRAQGWTALRSYHNWRTAL